MEIFKQAVKKDTYQKKTQSSKKAVVLWVLACFFLLLERIDKS